MNKNQKNWVRLAVLSALLAWPPWKSTGRSSCRDNWREPADRERRAETPRQGPRRPRREARQVRHHLGDDRQREINPTPPNLFHPRAEAGAAGFLPPRRVPGPFRRPGRVVRSTAVIRSSGRPLFLLGGEERDDLGGGGFEFEEERGSGFDLFVPGKLFKAGGQFLEDQGAHAARSGFQRMHRLLHTLPVARAARAPRGLDFFWEGNPGRC